MIKNIFRISAFTLLLSSTSVLADDYKVVTDKNGDPVRSNLSNSCVYTKWRVSDNICSGASDKRAGEVNQQQRNVVVITNNPQFSEADRTVYFNFDKAELTSSEKNKLRNLVQKIEDTGEVYDGVIVGYADEIGDSGYNQQLSNKRVNTVKSYLDDQGFKTSKIDLRARGENNSVTNCSDNLSWNERVLCLGEDRRVEVELQVKNNQQLTQR